MSSSIAESSLEVGLEGAASACHQRAEERKSFYERRRLAEVRL